MSIEAMKQALNAMLNFESVIVNSTSVHKLNGEDVFGNEILALEQAIEQAEKPVGYLFDFEIDGELVKDWFVMREHAIEPTAQNIRPLYAAPPQREWVGLTDEEIRSICDENYIMLGAYAVDFMKAIEAKLKEKNHVS
jgi:hypothetical protein